MLIYRNTGLKDYVRFISQHGLKGSFVFYERIDKPNSFLHISKELDHLYNVDLSFWRLVKEIDI